MSMEGPPRTMMEAPAVMGRFSVCIGRMVPTPPTMQIGLWYPRSTTLWNGQCGGRYRREGAHPPLAVKKKSVRGRSGNEFRTKTLI